MNRRGFTLLEIVVAASLFSIVMLTATGLFVATTRGQKRTQSLVKVQDDARFVIEAMAGVVRTDGIDYSYYRDPDQVAPLNPVNLAVPQSILVTKNQAGKRTVYFRYQRTATGPFVIGVCTHDPGEVPAAKCIDGNLSYFADVTPSTVSISVFSVFIRPFSDPFALSPAADSDCNPAHTGGFGYDSTKGACTCTVPNVGNDCFADQTCVNGVCSNANIEPRATILVTSTGGSTRAQENITNTFQTTVSSRIYQR